MLRILGVILGLAAIWTARPAVAGDWVFVSVDDRVAVGVDLASIRSVRGLTGQAAVAIWSTVIFSEPQLHENDVYDYRLTRFVIDCNADTISPTASVGYQLDESSTVFSDTSPMAPRAIVPDSIGQVFRDAACERDTASIFVNNVSDLALLARLYLNDSSSLRTVDDLNQYAMVVMVGMASEADAAAAAGEAVCMKGNLWSEGGDTAADAAADADAAATQAAIVAAAAADAAAAREPND